MRHPWWQVTTKPAYGFVLGALWGLQAVLEWIWVASGGTPLRTCLAVLMTALAAAYLVSSERLRRRLRSRPTIETRGS